MPTILQLRRGTTAQNNAFTGSAGELTFNTTTKSLRAHDGTTAGGAEMMLTDGSNSGSSINFAGDIHTSAQGDVRFLDSDKSNFVAFQAPSTISANVTWTLPSADAGTSGYALVSDGAGTLSWAAAGATISQDESTNTNFNLYFASTTSGALTSVKYDTGVHYNPSTGKLTTGQLETAGDATVGGDMTVTGNLTISGTQTTVNSTSLSVADLNIIVASGAADSASADGAGLTVDGAGATFTYVHSGTKWSMNKPLSVTGNVTATYLSGTATQALYADLAENYEADDNYAPGTVLIFGGEAEVTIATASHDTRVAGIVSTNPAYLMNKDNGNTTIGLTGRVPCQVKGPVDKGTLLVTSETPGVAQALNDAYYKPGCVIGKSMGKIDNSSIEVIEVAVGRF